MSATDSKQVQTTCQFDQDHLLDNRAQLLITSSSQNSFIRFKQNDQEQIHQYDKYHHIAINSQCKQVPDRTFRIRYASIKAINKHTRSINMKSLCLYHPLDFFLYIRFLTSPSFLFKKAYLQNHFPVNMPSFFIILFL